ncbi:glycoprotein-N-acetylgalactosamine 3-beta-galactosyltransferase 1-like [Babylonia areolata]|uniref:glycoprotein-N-acetylgalactosamine 3-beta-galactosyltransferase 1-like n=1 Tax=Babylonia areolata TaxID=304850 RepID=UPI003FD0794F
MGNVRFGRLVQLIALSGAVGILLVTLVDIRSLKYRVFLVHCQQSESHPADAHETQHSDPTLMIDDSAASALRKRARVLCWVPSTFKQLNAKLKAVNETWITRCDGHIFFVEGQWAEGQRPWDVVSLDVPPGYYNLTTKVVTVLLYLHRYHLHDYDWFLKGDDDAYIVMENLRYVLDQYNARDPVYLGHLYRQFHSQGYMSGGASYVLSREALRRVVEEGYWKNKCATKGKYEDVEVGRCLHKAGVGSHSSRDRFGRDTFHPLRPATHIVGPIPANQAGQDYFPIVSGKECCSQLTISFHKVDPSLMRVFDQLLYRTSVYGHVLDMPALQGMVKPSEVPSQK